MSGLFVNGVVFGSMYDKKPQYNLAFGGVTQNEIANNITPQTAAFCLGMS